MESEFNIESLPDHVLEEIFSYSSDKKNLREVSKRFCDIVNFSPKLMSKFALNVNRIKKEDINNIIGRYQNLKFNNIDSNDVEFIKQYNYKQFVKNIHFDIVDEDTLIEKLDWFKSILSECGHLLDIQLECLWSCISFHNIDYIRREEFFIFENIMSLKINNLRVLTLFRNAPNLKKLNIDDVNCEDFIQPINWQLKELHINDLQHSKMDAFVEFLETQRSTLTTLKINWCSNILNDIVHTLPNLEVLHLQVSEQDYINDEWLLPNDKLKELAIINTYMFNGRLLEQILKHYRNVEILYISVDETIKIEHELRLTNIKHLTVTEESFGILKYLRSDNLKSLNLLGEKIGKFDDVPKDILNKVETLKVIHMENLEILANFPALRHLYLISMYCNSEKELEILLSNVLEVTNLKSLSLDKYNWKLGVSPPEFLSQKGLPDTIIKLYEIDYDMLSETDLQIVQKEQHHHILIENYEDDWGLDSYDDFDVDSYDSEEY